MIDGLEEHHSPAVPFLTLATRGGLLGLFRLDAGPAARRLMNESLENVPDTH
jgi:hypothetical protein